MEPMDAIDIYAAIVIHMDKIHTAARTFHIMLNLLLSLVAFIDYYLFSVSKTTRCGTILRCLLFGSRLHACLTHFCKLRLVEILRSNLFFSIMSFLLMKLFTLQLCIFHFSHLYWFSILSMNIIWQSVKSRKCLDLDIVKICSWCGLNCSWRYIKNHDVVAQMTVMYS
jgi:hypothetical protein